MKRFALFLLLAVPLLAAGQQSISNGMPVLVYSLPKTVLEIRITSEKISEKPGQFYQYSERFLATTDVITSEKTYYRLKGVSFSTATIPDMARTYKIFPTKKSLTSKLTVNNKGLLCGINSTPENTDEKEEIRRDDVRPQGDKAILPLSEEYMLAGSAAKMAEGVAKQIYRIRESRIDLLSGDVENIPKDGDAIKTMIGQMDAQEKALTELFTGKIVSESVTQTITYVPVSAVSNEVVFRFSSYGGLIDKNDLSGIPYYITISYTPIQTQPIEKKKKVKEEVFSVLPVTAQITLSDGEKTIYRKDVTLPQLGVLVPLPLETMDKYSKVVVSPETGRLLSVEQMPKK